LPEELQTLAESPAAPSTEEQNTTEAPAATEQQQEPEGEEQESSEEQPKPIKGGFQKRIDRLTREKEFWKAEALKSAQPVAEQAQTEPEKAKPTRQGFESDDAFLEALADYKVEQKLAQADTERKKQEAVAPLVKAQQEFASSVRDYHETMREATDVPVNEQVANYIRDVEIGPQLGYFLAKNPDEAQHLITLGPAALAKAITALEPRFLKPTPPAKTATVSTAPPPPKSTGKPSGSSEKNPEEMSPTEYRAWRAKKYPNL
jgi:hypothetical protein